MFNVAQGGLSHVSSTAIVFDSRAWTHPKITPFRLAFILTTGGLGIAKTILVANGKSASSTTVEWISGVVVALMWVISWALCVDEVDSMLSDAFDACSSFQLFGAYDCEYNNARPRYLDRLFCYDCLERSNTAIAEPHPDFRNLRRLSFDRSQVPHIVTAYRLLVSIMFAAFGLVKMLCGYLGFSSAMYTLDWIIAIPLTLGLYCIGLYEESRSRSLRKFFEVDHSSQTLRTFKIGFVNLGSIVLCTFWFKLFLRGLRASLAYSIPLPLLNDIQNSAVWNTIMEHLFKWTATSFCLAMLEVGAVCLGGVLWPVIEAWSGRYANSVQYYCGYLVAFVTCYSFWALICIYLVLFFLFFSAQISVPLFNDPNISLVERIVLFWTMVLMAMLGIPPVIVLFKLPKILRTIGRSLLNMD